MSVSGWLIEHYAGFCGTPQWLRIAHNGTVNGIPRGELSWTDNAELALRFARKHDAQDFALLHPTYCTLATVTEHVYMDRVDIPQEAS